MGYRNGVNWLRQRTAKFIERGTFRKVTKAPTIQGGTLLDGAPRCPETQEGDLAPEEDPLCPVSRSGRIVRGVDVRRDFYVNQGDILGTGCSGKVVAAARRSTGQRVAVKCFIKPHMKERQLKRVAEEVNVHLQVDHPNICRLLHVYETVDKVCLVMELCRCELFHRLKQNRIFSEDQSRDAAVQMLKAVGYLHSHNLIHRDLKLENWMYSKSDGAERLKLIDFGFSLRMDSADEVLSVPCGTMLYVSPELLLQSYTSKTDIWSLGVICYMLLTGCSPFKGNDSPKLAAQIRAGKFGRDATWRHRSEGARDFVTSLLRKDASLRVDAQTALRHPWLCQQQEEILPIPRAAGGTFTQACGNLWRFGRGSRLQRAALRALVCSLASCDLEHLEQAFLDLDATGRGTISRKQLQGVVQRHCPEVSNLQIDRILDCLDFGRANEVAYSGFVTAMLAASVDKHEEKVRYAFDAFDVDRTGFLTADNLQFFFVSQSKVASRSPAASQDARLAEPSCCLSRAEAEAWIAEVDFKGNGALDFEGFVSVLQGQRREAIALRDEDRPTVKVFGCDLISRACSSPTLLSPSASTRASSSEFDSLRLESGHHQTMSWLEFTPEPSLRVREVAYDVDSDYFSNV